jgi:serine/threonine protein kinase
VLSPNIVLQNRYRVVRQLGQGGMGTVYEAVDQRLSSVVAIKEVTNRNGFASFTNVPCGDVAKITAPGIKLQFKSETLSITHNLQCSGSELYLGSYGDIKGALVSEKFANACFKPY